MSKSTVHFGPISHNSLSEASKVTVYINDEWAGEIRKDSYPVWHVDLVSPKFSHLLYHADLGESMSESRDMIRDMVSQQEKDS